jgi:hypothetical protein
VAEAAPFCSEYSGGAKADALAIGATVARNKELCMPNYLSEFRAKVQAQIGQVVVR